jgi:hypothetical protein
MNLQKIITGLTALLLISCSSNSAQQMVPKKFKEPDNTAVFTTKFVIVDNKDITTVKHDEDDGAWEFFSDDNFDDFEKVAKLVGLGQIVKLDSSLLELADMPIGYFAHRKSEGDKWVIEKQSSAKK